MGDAQGGVIFLRICMDGRVGSRLDKYTRLYVSQRKFTLMRKSSSE